MAKIKEITENHILFDDGSIITFDHYQECCEYNYADFEQIDDIARSYDYDTSNLMFESVDNSGFRFGDNGMMFFVPCYSEQNGYYTDDIDIYLNGNIVLSFKCEEVLL